MTKTQIIGALVTFGLLLGMCAVLYWPSKGGEKAFTQFLKNHMSADSAQSPLFTIESVGIQATNAKISLHLVVAFIAIFLAIPYFLSHRTIMAHIIFQGTAVIFGLVAYLLVYPNYKMAELAQADNLEIFVESDVIWIPIEALSSLTRPEQKRAAIKIYADLKKQGRYLRIERNQIKDFGFVLASEYNGLVNELYISFLNPSIETNLSLPDLQPTRVEQLKAWLKK